MLFLALGSFLAGILAGQFFGGETFVGAMDFLSTWGLNLLVLSVGIDIGLNKGIFKRMRVFGLKILLIPASIIAGSVAGGILGGVLTGLPVRESASIASGLGWYSFSSVYLNDLVGPQVGTMALLSNLCRELLTFLIIPPIAKKMNIYTTIAPAAATSGDSTLLFIEKYSNEEVAVMAVLNGVLLTALVPFLVPLVFNLFSI
ncbi:lysine exporter LysO family protein [Candidatus Soleaferrea massiliensis]|uniref:lysine exporter LysO family protein n=1 Tax=Candidatus Soleaferrea massiliensis TaxID=1470354 RepID=UPI00058C8E90|nr:lysine exporter LysO family protein [Candidatus Soleaferrea massiliensis]